MPRLTQDSDVDTDLPVEADIDDMSVSQIPYNLPGEDPEFSLFMDHMRISRILFDCLDQLYTTKRRRGGIQKIVRLDRRLLVWKENLQGGRDIMAVILEDLNKENRPLKDQLTQTMMESPLTLWTHLLAELATVLIHRPALTFDPKSPQFSQSLQRCVEASANIIILRAMHDANSWLFNMWPLGSHILLQSALMLLFNHWHGGTGPSCGRPTKAGSENTQSLVDITVDVLRRQHHTFVSSSIPSPVAQFLSHLRIKSFQNDMSLQPMAHVTPDAAPQSSSCLPNSLHAPPAIPGSILGERGMQISVANGNELELLHYQLGPSNLVDPFSAWEPGQLQELNSFDTATWIDTVFLSNQMN